VNEVFGKKYPEAPASGLGEFIFFEAGASNMHKAKSRKEPSAKN
jgi:hypothetical protein